MPDQNELISALLSAQQLRQGGNLDGAVRAYQRIVQMDSSCVEAHATLAAIFLSAGRQADAIVHLEAVATLKPEVFPAEVYLDLARLCKEQNNAGKAVQYYELSLSMKPDLKAAPRELAEIYKSQGNIAAAISSLESAMEKNPELRIPDPQEHINFSNLALLARLKEARFEIYYAISEASKVLPSLAGNEQLIVQECLSLLHHGQCSKALALLQEKAESQKEMHFECLFCFLLAQFALRVDGSLLALAIEKLSDFVTQYSEIAEAFMYLGILLYTKIHGEGQSSDTFDTAFQVLEQAINRKPDLSEAFYHMWHIRYLQGRIEESMPYIQRSIDIDRQEQGKHPLGKSMWFLGGFTYAMGHLAESAHTWVKLKQLGWAPEGEAVLLAPPGQVANQCLLEYWRDHFTVIDDFDRIDELRPLAKKLFRRAGFPILEDGRVVIEQCGKGFVHMEAERRGLGPALQLKAEHAEKGRQCLKELGVPENAWYVGVHVREGGYKREVDDTYNARRNAEIDSYVSAFKEITDRGGWVIRLGEKSMKPLPQMPQVVDLAHSPLKSDWMDIFVCASAKFCIVTTGGLYSTPLLFDTPVIGTNMPDAFFHVNSWDLFLPKLMRDTKSGELISFNRMMNAPFYSCERGQNFIEWGVEFIDNTPEEIREAVLEMLAKLDKSIQYSEEDEQLQQQFKNLPLASLGPFLCRIGKDFLFKHRDLLE